MLGEDAEGLDEEGAAAAVRGWGWGGCGGWGAVPGAWGGRIKGGGLRPGQPRGGPGGGVRYLKLGGEARCSPRKGEEAGGDAAPFSRSAIPRLSPCRRREGGRAAGKEAGREAGGRQEGGDAGGDVPAAGGGSSCVPPPPISRTDVLRLDPPPHTQMCPQLQAEPPG